MSKLWHHNTIFKVKICLALEITHKESHIAFTGSEKLNVLLLRLLLSLEKISKKNKNSSVQVNPSDDRSFLLLGHKVCWARTTAVIFLKKTTISEMFRHLRKHENSVPMLISGRITKFCFD